MISNPAAVIAPCCYVMESKPRLKVLKLYQSKFFTDLRKLVCFCMKESRNKNLHNLRQYWQTGPGKQGPSTSCPQFLRRRQFHPRHSDLSGANSDNFYSNLNCRKLHKIEGVKVFYFHTGVDWSKDAIYAKIFYSTKFGFKCQHRW